MPGICGILEPFPGRRLSSTLARMLDSMTHHEWYTRESHIDEKAGLALGGVALGFGGSSPRPVEDARTGSAAILDGEIYNSDELAEVLRAIASTPVPASPASLLLRGYLSEGAHFLTRVNGKFAIAIWDGRHRQLLLLNDRFGMKPIFHTAESDRFAFASEIKALLVDSRTPRRHNQRGIAQFFSLGQLWNEDTFYEAIRTLPPAACVRYEADTGRVAVERYWQVPRLDLSGLDVAELLERINVAFRRAVDVQTRGTGAVGLSLSGGMDSRSILAAVDHPRVRPTCVSIGMPGSQDHACAEQLARLAGCRYERYHLDDRLLSNFGAHLQRMVQLTDGHYLSQCIVMPTLPFYRQVGIRTLLRGHAGELFHLQKAYNFSHDHAALALHDSAALERWLFDHLRAWILDSFEAPLFACMETGEVDAFVRRSLQDSLADSEGWEPPARRISHLFLRERLRRETAMSLVKFNSIAETRVPFLDPELIPLILSTPTEMKLGDTIQSHILRRQFPAFLNVTNVNTGARVDAGRLARFWGRGKQRVFAKLGVKGYQPYERLGLWLRRELRPLVRSILLDDRCLDRGIFRPAAVRQVIEQHFGNERNHTFLLLAMMIFETGQRTFVDGEPIAQVDEECLSHRSLENVADGH